MSEHSPLSTRSDDPWACEGCQWVNVGYVPECDGCGEPKATALLSRSGALAELAYARQALGIALDHCRHERFLDAERTLREVVDGG